MKLRLYAKLPALLCCIAACECGGGAAGDDTGVRADAAAPGDGGVDAGVADTCADCDGGSADLVALPDRPVADRLLQDGPPPDIQGADSAPGEGGLADASPEDAAGLPPQAPLGVEAFAGASVRLVFAPAARAESYQALLALASGGPYSEAGPAAATTEIVVRGLPPGLRHYFVVRALNAAGASPPSREVSAVPLDGVSHRRGTIGGTVFRHGVEVAGAQVRLYDGVDRGQLLAEAASDQDGRYTLSAPSGLYRGLVAGLDLPPLDGEPFEIGHDATGAWLPSSSSGWPLALEVREGEIVDGVDIHIAVQSPPCQVQGMVWRGAGWPLGPIVVEALPTASRLRAAVDVLTEPLPYDLALPEGGYEIQAFLDVDGDGEQGVNEPRDRYLTTVTLSAPGCAVDNRDIVLPAQGSIGGTLRGAAGWSVGAADERWQVPALYSAAAPDGVAYALAVPQDLDLSVSAFLDLDHNGRRSFFDADADGVRSATDEEWAEPGLPAITGVRAGDSGIDFDLGPPRRILGTVTPAMVPWRVIARDAEGERVFVGEAAPDGSYALEVAAHAAYYVYAFEDSDGNERRTLGREPLLLHGAVVDASSGDVEDVAIVQRTLRGRLSGDRSDPAAGQRETVVVQQIVAGVGGGLFCAWPAELNNYARPAADGSFEVQVGAVGSGGGSLPWSDCQPSCTGLTVTRYLDYGGDYVHMAEGCGAPLPFTYPASPAEPGVEALVLDSSAGDLSGIFF